MEPMLGRKQYGTLDHPVSGLISKFHKEIKKTERGTDLFDMKCFRNSKAKTCLLSLLLLLLLNDIIELRINVCYRLDEAISFGKKNDVKQKEISGKENSSEARNQNFFFKRMTSICLPCRLQRYNIV